MGLRCFFGGVGVFLSRANTCPGCQSIDLPAGK